MSNPEGPPERDEHLAELSRVYLAARSPQDVAAAIIAREIRAVQQANRKHVTLRLGSNKPVISCPLHCPFLCWQQNSHGQEYRQTQRILLVLRSRKTKIKVKSGVITPKHTGLIGPSAEGTSPGGFYLDCRLSIPTQNVPGRRKQTGHQSLSCIRSTARTTYCCSTAK